MHNYCKYRKLFIWLNYVSVTKAQISYSMAAASDIRDTAHSGNNIKKQRNVNTFVGMQIKDQTISKNFVDFQNKLVMGDQNIKKALISPQKIHITLLVTFLDGKEDFQRVDCAMKEATEHVRILMKKLPLELKFCGIGHFNRRVLFLKLDDMQNTDTFQSVVAILKEAFTKNGLKLPDKRGVTPHITIAKPNSRTCLKELRNATAPEEIEKYRSTYFGEDKIDCLQLLSMDKPEAEDGYYFKEGEYCFTN